MMSTIIIDMLIFFNYIYFLTIFAEFFSYLAKTFSLGLRLTANMIDSFALKPLIFFFVYFYINIINNMEFIISSSCQDGFIYAIIVYSNAETDKSRILSILIILADLL
jgi:F0F1-type ATP synthase membrane subunit a